MSRPSGRLLDSSGTRKCIVSAALIEQTENDSSTKEVAAGMDWRPRYVNGRKNAKGILCKMAGMDRQSRCAKR
jgi:hypothetical protein